MGEYVCMAVSAVHTFACIHVLGHHAHSSQWCCCLIAVTRGICIWFRCDAFAIHRLASAQDIGVQHCQMSSVLTLLPLATPRCVRACACVVLARVRVLARAQPLFPPTPPSLAAFVLALKMGLDAMTRWRLCGSELWRCAQPRWSGVRLRCLHAKKLGQQRHLVHGQRDSGQLPARGTAEVRRARDTKNKDLRRIRGGL